MSGEIPSPTIKFEQPAEQARPVTFDEILDAVNRLIVQVGRMADALEHSTIMQERMAYRG